MLTIRFSIHALGLGFIDARVLSLHATWHSPHHSLGSSDSPRPACFDLRVWSLWILLVADQKCAEEA